jgi:hypothetical protein
MTGAAGAIDERAHRLEDVDSAPTTPEVVERIRTPSVRANFGRARLP